MAGRGRRIAPGPGQESVWDYPRPPAIERTTKRIEVVAAGRLIVDTTDGVRILETSHPPTYYVRRADLLEGARVVRLPRSTLCEFKGRAGYADLQVGERRLREAIWFYEDLVPGYELLEDRVGFYADRVDEVRLDGELVRAQEGGFYSGWITDEIVGPFKGGPGTWGW